MACKNCGCSKKPSKKKERVSYIRKIHERLIKAAVQAGVRKPPKYQVINRDQLGLFYLISSQKPARFNSCPKKIKN